VRDRVTKSGGEAALSSKQYRARELRDVRRKARFNDYRCMARQRWPREFLRLARRGLSTP
jgi:hypothetical protein